MLRTMILLLFLGMPLLGQDFTLNDEVRKNPARFRYVHFEDTFVVRGTGEYTYVFPKNISTYRMPSCEWTNADTKQPATLEWKKVARDRMIFTAPKGERIHIKCDGLELKPWRAKK
jgi:hypothetical protein